MARMREIHTGAIKVGLETVSIVVRPKRHLLLFELNNWLFDYSYANDIKPFLQLPPLDDWTQSHEDTSHWHVNFPTINALAFIRTEMMEFS